MQLIEIALLACVALLALALIGTIVRSHVRPQVGARRSAADADGKLPADPSVPAPGPPLVCPTCFRDYAPGLQFCPHDARALVPAGDPAARRAGAGATCPVCKRSFEPGKRFCSFDGEELVPLMLAVDDSGVKPFAGMLVKICPSCSRRYHSDATFCGRDGEELVGVN
jgi:hypothetical protein